MVILVPVRQRKTCPKCGSYRIDRKRKYNGFYYCVDCKFIFQSPILKECRTVKIVPLCLKTIIAKKQEQEAYEKKKLRKEVKSEMK
jgi:ribosomal protein L37AE/L43A